jgi:hypothetical protein
LSCRAPGVESAAGVRAAEKRKETSVSANPE